MNRILNTKTYALSGGSSVTIFESVADGSLTLATVEQKGRYPEEGKASVNNVAHETMHIVEGSIELHIPGAVTTLNAGDALSIPPETPYWLTGKAKVIVAVTPSVEKNKNSIIDLPESLEVTI